METVRNETSYAPVDKNVANGKPHTGCKSKIGRLGFLTIL